MTRQILNHIRHIRKHKKGLLMCPYMPYMVQKTIKGFRCLGHSLYYVSLYALNGSKFVGASNLQHGVVLFRFL